MQVENFNLTFNKKLMLAFGRICYGFGIAGIAILQIIYSGFRPVILPISWPAWLHATPVWAWLVGLGLLIAGILIILAKKTFRASLWLGAALLVLFLAFQVVYVLLIQPNSPRHMGLWVDELKELALSGGAFIIAGASFADQPKPALPAMLTQGRLLFAGRLFFSITMITFGYGHFLYPDSVSRLVPDWMPGHYFWTYLAGAALIGSGIALVLNIKIVLISLLQGTMIFLWFLVLHIPRAIADPYLSQSNEVTSVFEALAYSGVGFMISSIYLVKQASQVLSPEPRTSP
jgi:uncharacterized membrane protein